MLALESLSKEDAAVDFINSKDRRAVGPETLPARFVHHRGHSAAALPMEDPGGLPGFHFAAGPLKEPENLLEYQQAATGDDCLCGHSRRGEFGAAAENC